MNLLNKRLPGSVANGKRRDAGTVRNATLLGIAVLGMCCICCVSFAAMAQDQGQTKQGDQGVPASALVKKTVQAVGYQVGAGGTKVDLVGTDLGSQRQRGCEGRDQVEGWSSQYRHQREGAGGANDSWCGVSDLRGMGRHA